MIVLVVECIHVTILHFHTGDERGKAASTPSKEVSGLTSQVTPPRIVPSSAPQLVRTTTTPVLALPPNVAIKATTSGNGKHLQIVFKQKKTYKKKQNKYKWLRKVVVSKSK